MKPIPKDSDVFTIEEFIKMVKEGCFIDYDGCGVYATDKEMSNITIYPSDITGRTDRFNEKTGKMEIVSIKKKLNKNFTHVVWYNR